MAVGNYVIFEGAKSSANNGRRLQVRWEETYRWPDERRVRYRVNIRFVDDNYLSTGRGDKLYASTTLPSQFKARILFHVNGTQYGGDVYQGYATYVGEYFYETPKYLDVILPDYNASYSSSISVSVDDGAYTASYSEFVVSKFMKPVTLSTPSAFIGETATITGSCGSTAKTGYEISYTFGNLSGDITKYGREYHDGSSDYSLTFTKNWLIPTSFLDEMPTDSGTMYCVLTCKSYCDSNGEPASVKTTYDGQYYGNYLGTTTSQFLVKFPKSYSPTIEPSFVYNHPELTGSDSVAIKGYGAITASMVVTPLEGATVTATSITNGDTTFNSTSGTFNNVVDNNFIFTATDSRDMTTELTAAIDMVDYFKPTIAFKNYLLETTGTLTLTFTGMIFNQSFGAEQNTFHVYFKIGDSGAVQEATNVTVNENNIYTAVATVEGLDYRSTYKVYANIADSLFNVAASPISVSSFPIFDWSKDDFNFNVPVTMQDSLEVKNNLTVGGNFSFSGDLSSPNDTVNVNKPLTVNGDLTVNGKVITQGVEGDEIKIVDSHFSSLEYSDKNNEEWNYRVWSDGTAECWMRFKFSGPFSTSGKIDGNTNTYYSSALGMRTYPFVFETVPTETVNLSTLLGSSESLFLRPVNSNTTEKSTPYLIATYSSSLKSLTTLNVYIHYHVIGKIATTTEGN